MGKAIRCRITGCDLDDCGVCRRCGGASAEQHDWQPGESDNPCYVREVCSRCDKERQQPAHDWVSSPSHGPDGVALECSRCGLTI